jgi:F420-dependent oxidoreductase-like protein
MRFGAFVPQGWRTDLAGIAVADQWDTMLGVARAIEASGFESLWVFDHFHTVPVPSQEVTYEAWTLMAAFAAATDTVRLGQMCTCNSYRHPSYLAKVASSIDAISGGRVEMGIGAGWYEHEYRGYGYDFPKPSVRIGMLRESVEIMRAMWTEDEAHYQGDYYRLDGAICRPKPVQQPHIPLWVAGGGEQLTLDVAARYASYTNFGQTIEEFVHKSEVLRGHCERVGTDYEAIVRSSNFNLVCAETEAGVDEALDRVLQVYAAIGEGHRSTKIAESYRLMSGTPDQIIEKLRPWQEVGMDYAIVYFGAAAYDTSGIELFGREVIPALA